MNPAASGSMPTKPQVAGQLTTVWQPALRSPVRKILNKCLKTAILTSKKLLLNPLTNTLDNVMCKNKLFALLFVTSNIVW